MNDVDMKGDGEAELTIDPASALLIIKTTPTPPPSANGEYTQVSDGAFGGVFEGLI